MKKISIKNSASLSYQVAKAFGLQEPSSKTVCVVVPTTQAMETLCQELSFFLEAPGNKTGENVAKVFSFGSWEVLPFDVISPSPEISAARLATLYQLLSGKPIVVVATIQALMQKLVEPRLLLENCEKVSCGDVVDRDAFIEVVTKLGYQRVSLVEEHAQMAVRGAVVDIFSPLLELPVRFEFFGDVLESIRTFDPATQRSQRELESFTILPARELFLEGTDFEEALEKAVVVLKERADELDVPRRSREELEEAIRSWMIYPGLELLQPLFVSKQSSFFDYLPDETTFILSEELQVEGEADAFSELITERIAKALAESRVFPKPEDSYLSAHEVIASIKERGSFSFNSFGVVSVNDDSGDDAPLKISTNEELRAKLQASRRNELPFQPLAKELQRSVQEGCKVVIAVSSASRMKRFIDLLETYDISPLIFESGFSEWRKKQMPSVSLLEGALSAGFKAPEDSLHLISDREIFPDISFRKASKKAANIRRFIGSLHQLKEQDYIVHVEHGVGMYRGLKQILVDGKLGDFLELEYAEGAKLFIPIENIARIQKYTAAEGKVPELSKLGTKQWAKAKAKVKENVAELAGKLVTLYAEREIVSAETYGDVSADDLSFADTFGFEPTPDQGQAIEAVLADLNKEKPMDRLVCGDVGFGKTEVALRAAFKVANTGKQVAMLVPTTILADQHYETFKERFSSFPFSVGIVSRFNSPQENKDTLEKLRRGEVDIIIGTHRLLQKDVLFHDVGLIIIDEEHRFGVTHKERLKSIRKNVHVLTLTATPIPRTLHMSLVGIRDMSIIATPPADRQVIRTYVVNFDPNNQDVVREAILRELGRSGQILYIHNRVTSIAGVAEEVQALIPEGRVRFAHGQMNEKELEDIMHKFVKHEFDILVSTTIVESGLDIPNVNTIIIRNAEHFGLAELYQLRGRVGRSSRRAYAYLLVTDPKKLGADAKKRLQVLQSLDDLGLGFSLALQDMEIRGAGNLLGRDQSGHITLVGFELYSQILKEAINEVRERRGEIPKREEKLVVEPEVSIGFPAYVPEFYIPDVAERILLYQRLVELRDDTEALDLVDEMRDRFGAPPKEVEVLIELMMFRSLLKRAAIVSAVYRGEMLRLVFHPDANVDGEKLLSAINSSEGDIKLSGERGVGIHILETSVHSPGDFKSYVRKFLCDIGVQA